MMGKRFSKEERERLDAYAIHERIEYRYRNLLRGSGRWARASSWNAAKERWWRRTPERWAWLNEPNLRERENIHSNAECPDCLRWFKTSEEAACWFCEKYGVPEFPNRLRYESLRQGVSLRSIGRISKVEWRTVRMAYIGERVPHLKTRTRLLGALGLPKSKMGWLFPSKREHGPVDYPYLVERQVAKLKALDAFMLKHGRMPTTITGTSKKEQDLARFLSVVRSGRQRIYPRCAKLKLKSLPADWYVKKDAFASCIERQLEVLKEVDAFVLKHGREPRPKGSKRERWLCIWLRRMRNKSKNRLFAANKEYKVRGLVKDWWMTNISVTLALKILREIADFYIENKRYPQACLAKDRTKNERRLGAFVIKHRCAYGRAGKLKVAELQKARIKGLPRNWYLPLGK